MEDDHKEMQMEAELIHMPSGTAWPLGLAMGITLSLASLVTNNIIGMLGLVITFASIIGWFRQVLPHEAHEMVRVVTEVIPIETERRHVTPVEKDETHRAQLPLERYPLTSGLKGGFAGGTAMIILAEIYGILRYHSIWYVVNLLGGAGVAGWQNPTTHQLESFRLSAFLIAIVIHTTASFLVGLLYGALLPIMPNRPVLLGGLIAPALWTGVLHSTLGLVNPYFDSHINWWWFAASQVAFGVVAGLVVKKVGRIKSYQGVPLSVRLGVERPGHMQGHGPQGGGGI